MLELFFSGTSEATTKFWLEIFELSILLSAVILVAGLFGEFPESRKWKESRWYVWAKRAVIIGVAGELLADGGLFLASNHLQVMEDAAIGKTNRIAVNAVLLGNQLLQLNTNATLEIGLQNKAIQGADRQIEALGKKEKAVRDDLIALGNAETALEQDQRATVAALASVKKEAEDWLDAVTPRRIDGAISNLTHMQAPPIFIVAERGSDTEVLADDLVTAMNEGGLDAKPLKSDKDSMVEGVQIEYGYSTFEGAREDAIRVVADSVCKQISLQDVFAKVSPVHVPYKDPSEVWDKRVPVGAILILVGRNPSQFLFNKKNRKWGGPPIMSYAEMAPPDVPAAKWYCGNE